MLKNNPYNKIYFKNIPEGIDVYIVSNDVISNELISKYNFKKKYSSKYLKKNSFLRSRLLIDILDLRKNKNISISHTDGMSAVSVSNKYFIGIDIERTSKNFTEKMSKKILKENDGLGLKPIQIWTLMESSYKCLNCEGKHFLKYVFIKEEEEFFIFEKNQSLRSVTNNLNGYTYGISFNLDN